MKATLRRQRFAITPHGFRVDFTTDAPDKTTVSDYIEVNVEEDGSLVIRGFDGTLVVRPAGADNRIRVSLEPFEDA